MQPMRQLSKITESHVPQFQYGDIHEIFQKLKLWHWIIFIHTRTLFYPGKGCGWLRHTGFFFLNLLFSNTWRQTQSASLSRGWKVTAAQVLNLNLLLFDSLPLTLSSWIPCITGQRREWALADTLVWRLHRLDAVVFPYTAWYWKRNPIIAFPMMKLSWTLKQNKSKTTCVHMQDKLISPTAKTYMSKIARHS